MSIINKECGTDDHASIPHSFCRLVSQLLFVSFLSCFLRVLAFLFCCTTLFIGAAFTLLLVGSGSFCTAAFALLLVRSGSLCATAFALLLDRSGSFCAAAFVFLLFDRLLLHSRRSSFFSVGTNGSFGLFRLYVSILCIRVLNAHGTNGKHGQSTE